MLFVDTLQCRNVNIVILELIFTKGINVIEFQRGLIKDAQAFL